MLKYIFKRKAKDRLREELLAPETKPIIYEFEIKRQEQSDTPAKINYKLISEDPVEECWAV